MNQTVPPSRESIPVSNLDFDPNNPRFSTEIASGPEGDLIERFIRDERLLEILNSIADQGYFEPCPMRCEPEGSPYFHPKMSLSTDFSR